MNESTLNSFRHLAQVLSDREKIQATVFLKNGKELKAYYDPLSTTFTIGGMTFPVGELSTWTKL